MQYARDRNSWTEGDLSLRDRVRTSRAIVERLVAANEPVALYLDIDGTLLDVALTPSTVHIPPDLPTLLDELSRRLSGALAIVTGRPLAEADHLLKPAQLVAAGVHGAQMRLSVSGQVESLAPTLDPFLQADIRKIVEDLPGVVFEDKGNGIALHYRLAPEQQPALLLMLENLLSKYPDQFSIFGGRKVMEILPVGFSKGRALRKLATLPTFVNRTPVMIGDDIADVDAFQAAEELGGFGLKVAGEHFSKDEAAFQGPADVLNWLEKLSQAQHA
jgi:trehalose 6-phosphate phosphatase